MKFYKINRDFLKWNEEIPTVTYNITKLPILIDKDYNVLAGSSLRNVLGKEILVTILELSNNIKDALTYYEMKIAEENKETRYLQIQEQLSDYLHQLVKPDIISYPLFEYENTDIITEDNYDPPSEKVTYAHGIKKDNNIEEDQYDIKVDLELMKELL